MNNDDFDVFAKIHISPAPDLRLESDHRVTNKNLGAQTADIPDASKLLLRFSQGPNTACGMILGKSPSCDIPLPAHPDIDDYHCAVNFNERGQIVLQDLGSPSGTSVQYQRNDSAGKDSKAGRCVGPEGYYRLVNVGDIDNGICHFRRGFTWIISRHPFLDVQNPQIVVSVGGQLKLRIEPVVVHMQSQEYFEQTQRFRLGCRESTILMSSALRAIERKVLDAQIDNPEGLTIQSHLGSGGFGTVVHHWNVSSGDVYVIKRPTATSFSHKQWKREMEAFQTCSHENIIRSALPQHQVNYPAQICLEYAPSGSLEQQNASRPLTVMETFNVLCQCLSALSYLHAQRRAHRDIKPANIVVMWRNQSSGIFVKVADFGLSTVAARMTLDCGTPAYRAPEISVRNGYNHRVDLYSLGVMVSSFLLGKSEADTTDWKRVVCSGIYTCLIDQGCDLIEILCQMVTDEPKERGHAATHLARLSRLSPYDVVSVTGLRNLGL